MWTRCQPWAPPNGMATVVVYTSQEMAVPWQSEVTCVERGPWGPSSHWELPPPALCWRTWECIMVPVTYMAPGTGLEAPGGGKGPVGLSSWGLQQPAQCPEGALKSCLLEK